MADRDQPSTCEVAVSEDGKVIVNYQAATAGWGHLSFTVEQAKIFIEVLQTAVIQARHKRQGRN